jgi:DNA-binding CsgD family transcriptional regulator
MSPLTSRERRVIDLLLEGKKNKDIAADLGVSEQAAKNRVSRLMRKFGASNRAALVDIATRLDLLGGEPLERGWIPQLLAGAELQIAVNRGPDLRYVAVNESFAKAARRNVIGRTMREAFPELSTSGHFEIAERVFQTGIPFVAHEEPARWDTEDGQTTTYMDAIVQPLRGSDGAIEGIVYFGMDVTGQVNRRQRAPAKAPSS